jgi:shikimate kinase / 3-dehydroquinate synthase
VIVLVGFMGAGKTTVGRLVAAHAGLPFIDTDEVMERTQGESIADLFTRVGEVTFRTLERDTAADVLAGREAVIALGGGALGDPATCALLEWHTVVHLDVTYPEAMRRVGKDPGRPMLRIDDPKALYEQRKTVYARHADHRIPTDGLTPAEIATKVVAVAGAQPATPRAHQIDVHLADRGYSVFVGSDLISDLGRYLPAPPGSKAFVVTHPSLAERAKQLVDSLTELGSEVHVLTVDEGEGSKDLSVAARLYGDLAAAGGRRSDLLIGFGGGVVCDLAGFVASTYHRGMPVLHVPTTLLAQVDAAIGGKTAVDLPHGKNLVGTFHQPVAVVCDVELLETLPDEELRSGLAEVVKYGLIADPGLLGFLVEHHPEIVGRDTGVLTNIVRRSVAIKARVVEHDEREAGEREVLNYGHTFGHALEHVTGMRHGEAISVGMMAAASLGVDLGLLPEPARNVHFTTLDTLGLPTRADGPIDEVLNVLQRDKKHRSALRFVVLTDIGSPRVGVEASLDQAGAALRKVMS